MEQSYQEFVSHREKVRREFSDHINDGPVPEGTTEERMDKAKHNLEMYFDIILQDSRVNVMVEGEDPYVEVKGCFLKLELSHITERASNIDVVTRSYLQRVFPEWDVCIMDYWNDGLWFAFILCEKKKRAEDEEEGDPVEESFDVRNVPWASYDIPPLCEDSFEESDVEV